MSEKVQKLAELLEVPILKKGVFNGFQVSDLSQTVKDTMAALPYLKEGIDTGMYRGNRDELQGHIPGFLNLNHDKVAPETLKEWARDVEMELETRNYNGEEWIMANYRGVDPELAQLLSAAFPFRSVEILPNFQNPDTGEIYPAVIRSTAFLDRDTRPAVEQTPGYSVKFSLAEGVQTVLIDMEAPNTNTKAEGDKTMADEKKKETAAPVMLSSDDIQRLQALEAENKTLKGGLNTLKDELDRTRITLGEVQEKAREEGIQRFCAELVSKYNVSPAYVEIVKPLLIAKNGIVKLGEGVGSVEVDLEFAIRDATEGIAKLAEKNAITVPQGVSAPAGKQGSAGTSNMSDYDRKQAEIVKLQEQAKSEGRELTYADALMKVNSNREFTETLNFWEKVDGAMAAGGGLHG